LAGAILGLEVEKEELFDRGAGDLSGGDPTFPEDEPGDEGDEEELWEAGEAPREPLRPNLTLLRARALSSA